MSDTLISLPALNRRMETGPVRFGDDWPGMFVRGDDALARASMLLSMAQKVAADTNSPDEALVLALVAMQTGALLAQCDATGHLQEIAEATEKHLDEAGQRRFGISYLHPADQGAVRAEAHSDDWKVEVAFNAAPYFAYALRNGTLGTVLAALKACGFGGDMPADAVAEFFSDNATKPLFDYMRFQSGFECHVEAEDLREWVCRFAPDYSSLFDE